MDRTIFYRSEDIESHVNALNNLLNDLVAPYQEGDTIGIKLHWGERGNKSFLPPLYAREIVRWLQGKGITPIICDTSALYSGGRRTGKDSLETAKEHGFNRDYLGCPIIMGDGVDSRDIIEIDAKYGHFDVVEVASIIKKIDGFFIFSHFKGHIESGFAGAIKNLSMGFASRAQKQRIHSDAYPVLKKEKCVKCGTCVDVCPVGAATMAAGEYPEYDLDACIGCAQCIAMCPEVALKIFWSTSESAFQEKLVEAAAAVWKIIGDKSLIVNALIGITKDCDCMTGNNPVVAQDIGFVGGYHPVTVDRGSIRLIGEDIFSGAHPGVPWERQFAYAREIGFIENS